MCQNPIFGLRPQSQGTIHCTATIIILSQYLTHVWDMHFGVLISVYPLHIAFPLISHHAGYLHVYLYNINHFTIVREQAKCVGTGHWKPFKNRTLFTVFMIFVAQCMLIWPVLEFSVYFSINRLLMLYLVPSICQSFE